MRHNQGYFEEEALGKSYDTRLLKRLFPFLKPYHQMILVSIFLVMLITLLDLAIPYVTKIAIDQYIVPKMSSEVLKSDKPGTEAVPSRYLKIGSETPGVQMVVDRYPELFEKDGRFILISYQHLSILEPDDIAVLRKNDLAGVGWVAGIFLLIILLNFGFNFLQKLIDEILRLRREDEILMSEIDDILTEFGQQPDDDLCMLCGGPCHCLSDSSEDTPLSYISSADILIEELDELLIPSRSEPEYDYEDLEVKSLSELDTARLPVINDGRKRCKARKVEPRKRWSWPL